MDNLCICDKSTGAIEPLHTGDIDLCSQPPESIKKLLSGNKVEMKNKLGLNKIVGLNKTAAGWGISITEKTFGATTKGHIQHFFTCNMKEVVQLHFVKKDIFSIKNISDPTEKVQLYVVDKKPSLISEIKNPTERVQLMAIKKDKELLLEIDNPCISACQAAAKSACGNIILPTNESIIEPTLSFIFDLRDLQFEFFYKIDEEITKRGLENQESIVDDATSWRDLETSKLIDRYKANIGILDSQPKIGESIIKETVNESIDINTSNSIQELEIIASAECKILIGGVIGQKQTDNLRICDKSTGAIERLHTGDIDLCSQPPESIKKLLSGNKVEMKNKLGLNKIVGLNKTATGWGISIAKQTFNVADSSAGI